MNDKLVTAHLELAPITVDLVRAVIEERRAEALSYVERHHHATLPPEWPGRDLIERAFVASLDEIVRDPETRLWGDRLVLSLDEPRRVIGSVVFHGAPDADGRVEIAYGVAEPFRRNGYATEAVGATIDWAFRDARVQVVTAVAHGLNFASIRVLEKVGMERMGTRDHEILGELGVFERRRA